MRSRPLPEVEAEARPREAAETCRRCGHNVLFEQQLGEQKAVNAQQHAVNAQLQGQVAALTQQVADQAIQMQRQVADLQKRADLKPGVSWHRPAGTGMRERDACPSALA